jgi:predicted DNA-binding transcriptional regulator AlpA
MAGASLAHAGMHRHQPPCVTEKPMFANSPAVVEATLTLENLVAIYRVSRRTIWRWVAEGKIPPPYAVTRRVRRWKASEIQEHLAGLPRCTREPAVG